VYVILALSSTAPLPVGLVFVLFFADLKNFFGFFLDLTDSFSLFFFFYDSFECRADLDHTADVQIHSWGKDIREAFEEAAVAMFNYISPLHAVQDVQEITFSARGHDLESLFFSFLDEALFQFNADFFVCREVTIQHVDWDTFELTAIGRGEVFDSARHEHGTEIKAITYSNMQIHAPSPDRPLAEAFVIVDI
jgi:SHS2 domain-containing protein